MITRLFQKATFGTYVWSVLLTLLILVGNTFAQYGNLEIHWDRVLKMGLLWLTFSIFLFLIAFVERFQKLFFFRPPHLLAYPLALMVFPMEMFEKESPLFLLLTSILLNSFKKGMEEKNTQKHLFDLSFFITIISLYDLKWIFLYLFPISLLVDVKHQRLKHLIFFLLPVILLPFLWGGIVTVYEYPYQNILSTFPMMKVPGFLLFKQYGAWIVLCGLVVIITFLQEQAEDKMNPTQQFMKQLLWIGTLLVLLSYETKEYWFVTFLPIGFFLGRIMEKKKFFFIKNAFMTLFAGFFLLRIISQLV